MNNLLSRLSAQATMRRLAQTQPKPPKQTIKPKNTGQPQITPSNDAGNNDTDSTRPPSTLTAEDLALQATENIKTPLIKGLAQKQGRLPRPVNGSISGKFGENRPNGGIWKGLFFHVTMRLCTAFLMVMWSMLLFTRLRQYRYH